MPSSYHNLLYHIVFSTKYRKSWLIEDVRGALYAYLSGIITNQKGQLLEIGGVDDHVHLLTTCSPQVALADVLRDLKAGSSRWLHEEKRLDAFQWQTGYAAFTVSRSQAPAVRNYVRGQAEHHRKQTFIEEYRALLERHGIAFDDRYLFEEEHHG